MIFTKGILKTAGVLAVAVMVASCSGEKKAEVAKADDEAVKVEVAQSDFRAVPQVNSYTGTVEADVTNNIAPQSPMRIRKVLVEVGQHVAAGQKLADMGLQTSTRYACRWKTTSWSSTVSTSFIK